MDQPRKQPTFATETFKMLAEAPRIPSRIPHGDPASLGYDFALLGLAAREARVAVIRRAASRTAQHIQQAASSAEEREAMLANLTASTYRLLDPRKRQRRMERVQLCVLGESDLELQLGSRKCFQARTTVEPASSVRPHKPEGIFTKHASERMGHITLSVIVITVLSAAVAALLL